MTMNFITLVESLLLVGLVVLLIKAALEKKDGPDY